MLRKKTVRDFMTAQVATVRLETEIQEAIGLLIKEEVSAVPVVDDTGTLVGILSEKDCFKVAFGCCYYQARGGPVSDYMTRSPVTTEAETDIVALAEMLFKGAYRRFPVVAEGRLVGMISRRDALRAILEFW